MRKSFGFTWGERMNGEAYFSSVERSHAQLTSAHFRTCSLLRAPLHLCEQVYFQCTEQSALFGAELLVQREDFTTRMNAMQE